MAKNLGDKVSRVLDSKGRNYNGVVYQQKRPPLDSEFNLMQEIQSEKTAEVLRQTSPSGFLLIDGSIQGGPEDRNQVQAAWRNAIKFKNPFALVNGWVIHVGGGTNQFQENAIESIWDQLSGDPDEVAFILDEPPTVAQRDDLVWLEVWQVLLETEDLVNQDGFVQSALTDFDNDMIDPNIEIETSQRLQIQYRFRRAEGIDFTSFRDGLGHPGALPQGPQREPIAGYVYRKHDKDLGLYIVGDGSEKSQEDLGTVDGFIYAIPICRIHRRNKQEYDLTNQNGSQYSLLQGVISDRPDGLYHDEINTKDIEDLRHQVSLTGFDFENLMEENLNALWSKNIPGEIKRSSLDETVVGNKIIHVDAISGVAIDGADTANRVPDGQRRSFTEGKEFQKISITLVNPQTNGGALWFTPIGKQENGWEYELWNEELFYSRVEDDDYRPRIFEYDAALGIRNEITGGRWVGLGEYRTFDYIDDACKNKLQYIPDDIATIQNKNIVIMFDFVTREGGGIAEERGGFNYQIDRMLSATNLKDNRPIEFNNYESLSENKVLKEPRRVGDFVDSAVTRSITRFEEATIPSNTFDEVYKGGCIEIRYHVLSTGDAQEVIPDEVYGRSVEGIYSVFNITSQSWQNPSIEKIAGGYELDGLITDENDILQVTLLCGNYTVDYVKHTKGIKDIATNYVFTNAINVGDTEGVINVKGVLSQCEAVLANTGFFNGVNNRFIAYVNNQAVTLATLEGLGTPVIKYTFEDPSEVAGQIDIHLLGYYNPVTADQMYFEYEHIPYRGIINTRLRGENTERFKILHLDDRVTVTTAGTGQKDQYIQEDLKGLIETLPLNENTREYNFFGSSIETPITAGNASLRRIPGRGGVKDSFSEESSGLFESQILTLALNEDVTMLRGAVLQQPIIHERGFDFNVPQIRNELGELLTNPDTGNPYDIVFETDMTQYNHLTQWTALVESLDSFKGELFLLVITTTSTVYNAEEGLEHEYLQNKNLYRELAFGKGKETLIYNGLSESEINQRLGEKIVGAIDIFPLKGRPLVITPK